MRSFGGIPRQAIPLNRGRPSVALAAGDNAVASDLRERDERIEACQAMVRSLAWQISRRVPSSVDMDDLISEGQIGLLCAARDFDPAREVQFSTYAFWRIRGAMQDWIRRQGWFNFPDYLAGKLSETAGDEENALKESPVASRGVAAAEGLVDEHTPTPVEQASRAELRGILREIIAKLDSRPRRILEATLLEGDTLEEAGRKLGLHKGSVQRAQVKAFDQLMEEMHKRGLVENEGQVLRGEVFNRKKMKGRGG